MPYLTPIPVTIAAIPPAVAPGRLFRSAMPFRWDGGELLAEARREGVGTIVMLVSDKEALKKALQLAGGNLRAEYAARGMSCIQMPIFDYRVPGPAEKALFDESGRTCIRRLGEGRNLLVHCAAGIGRTGMFLACVLRRAEKVDGGEAILRIRSIPGMEAAVETQEQEDFVHLFPIDDP